MKHICFSFPSLFVKKPNTYRNWAHRFPGPDSVPWVKRFCLIVSETSNTRVHTEQPALIFIISSFINIQAKYTRVAGVKHSPSMVPLPHVQHPPCAQHSPPRHEWTVLNCMDNSMSNFHTVFNWPLDFYGIFMGAYLSYGIMQIYQFLETYVQYEKFYLCKFSNSIKIVC